MDRDDRTATLTNAIDDGTLAPAAVLEGLPDAVVVCGSDERIAFVNELAARLFGYDRDELVGRPVQTLWPERYRERYADNLRRQLAGPGAMRYCIEAWGRRRDGSEFVGEMSWSVVATAEGSLLVAIGRDISGRMEAEAHLRALAQLGERALAGTDAASLAAEAVDLLTASLPVAGAEVRTADGELLATTGGVGDAPLRISFGDGDVLALSERAALGATELGLARAVGNILAAALRRLRGEQRALRAAMHDPLTGLPNRGLLADRLEHAVAKAGRGSAAAAVLFVDLDEFKAVNDEHGHAAGDAVLAELGRRLRGAVRPGDTVARYGGDEFVAVCEEVDEAAAMMVGVRILEAVQRPFALPGGVPHEISASVGIALGRENPDGLLADADAAAYRAKANGRGRVELA